jgi:hypothetical protein
MTEKNTYLIEITGVDTAPTDIIRETIAIAKAINRNRVKVTIRTTDSDAGKSTSVDIFASMDSHVHELHHIWALSHELAKLKEK